MVQKIKKQSSPRAQMRQPIDARGLHGDEPGHFYVNPRSIDVYAVNKRAGVVACTRITKKQLEAALELMGKV